MDYKGIKIPEEITIVENAIGQGYVVVPGSSIDGALNWAKGPCGYWDDGKYIRVEKEPIVNTYKNGEFTLSLYDSANRSSQGGKLSFWNCTIHAKDGKDFIIGINSDILFELLTNTTIVNGDVQGNVWLGKEKNNTGVYTENMEMFKQAREEDKIRATVKSSKYEPMDIVSDLNDDYVYLGKFPVYIDIENTGRYWSKDVIVTIKEKPDYIHVYIKLYKYGSLSYTNTYKSKPAKMISGKKYEGNPQEIYASTIKDYDLNGVSIYNRDYYEARNFENIVYRMSNGVIPIDFDLLQEVVPKAYPSHEWKIVDNRKIK